MVYLHSSNSRQVGVDASNSKRNQHEIEVREGSLGKVSSDDETNLISKGSTNVQSKRQEVLSDNGRRSLEPKVSNTTCSNERSKSKKSRKYRLSLASCS